MNAIDREGLDILKCAALHTEFINARKAFVDYAKKLAVARCAFQVGDLVVYRSTDEVYRITEIIGNAIDGFRSDDMFCVTIKGSRVNRKNAGDCETAWVKHSPIR